MTPEQREKLKALALKVQPDYSWREPWEDYRREWEDAAKPDAILSLIAQVEALTVPQWISVKDRPPEDAIQVLGYSSKRKLVSTCYHYTDDSGTGWGSAVLYGSEITHWMPLPAAPTIPAIPGTKEDAPTLPYCANSYDDGKVVCDECNLTLGQSRMLAAWALAKEGTLRYTCIGKGGAYEAIGEARGAGTLKSSGRVRVYRDAVTGGLFYRALRDFDARMEVVKEDEPCQK